MCSHMNIQVSSYGKGFATNRTPKRPLSSVNHHVPFEDAVITKCLSAIRTEAVFLASVYSHVVGQSVFPVEPSATHGALERLFIGMDPHVHRQMRLLHVSVPTN